MQGKPAVTDPHFDSANGVLLNLRGFTERRQLDRFERRQALKALIDLAINPVRGNFDQSHLQAIHKRIFGQVYPWAGELRRVNIARQGSYPFALVQFLQKNLDSMFGRLASEGHLKALGVRSFVERAAFYLGELNTLHPFREGNGRTQREFIRELALVAGYRLNWSLVTQEQMYEASSLSHNLGKTTALANVVGAALGRPQAGRLP
ncbi:MAG: Fic family protein [Terracidiphilus sp.]|jgi:cell filamentation protein